MKCDHCETNDETVEYLPDPFLLEVDEEIDESYWCDSCFSDRKDDI